MANETRRKIVVEIEGQSKNFDKIVSDIQARLQEVGKTPSKAMEQQLKLYKAQFASLQNSLARLKDETQDIDEAAARSLHGQASRVSALVDSIITSFSRITLPPQISEQLKDLTEKLNVAKRSLKGLRGARTKSQQLLTPAGDDLSAEEKTRLYKKSASGLSESQQSKITTYAELQAQATKLEGKDTAKLTEENKKLLEVYKKVNEAIKERLQVIKDNASIRESKITATEQEIKDYTQQIEDLQKKTTSEQQQQDIQNITHLNDQRVQTTENLAKNFGDLNSKVDKNTVVENKNQKTITKSIGNFIKYQVVIRTLRRVLQSTISTITTMDEAMTGMAVVTSMNRRETWQLLSTWQKLASQTGKTTSEIASMATKFYQQGRSTNEVIKLTEAAAKAATIAGIDGSRSIDLLTNAINGFQLSANQAMEVSDKFAALAASAATDYEELAIALSKVAAQANLAGMSMDFTLGLLTKGIETTKEAPETIGTALKTVISRMRELSDYGKTLEDNVDVNRVEKALGYIGIELMDQEGQFRDLEDVLTEVGQKWETLTVNQQASIAVAMAGTRQQSRFIAMMQDFDRTLELAETSASSYGATLAQSAKYMDGLQAKITLLKNAWESLVTSETVTNLLIGGVKALTSVINLLSNNLLNIAIPALTLWVSFTIKDIVLTTKQILAKKELAKEEQKGMTYTISSTIAKFANWIITKKQAKAAKAHKEAVKDESQAKKEETTQEIANAVAKGINNKETKKAGATTKDATAALKGFGKAGGSATKTVASGVSKVGAVTTLVTIAIVAAATSVMLWRKAVREAHKTANDAAQKGIETLEKMQVEYYNLRQSAEKVDSLADSFDTLSRKINKSTEDLQELQSIAQQINDEAGKQVVDLDASLETQRKQVLAYQLLQKNQLKAGKAAMSTNIGTGYADALKANKKANTAHMWSSVGSGAAAGLAVAATILGILTAIPTGGASLGASAALLAGLSAAGAAAGAGIGAGTTSDVSEDAVKQAYIDQLKSTTIGKETLKQAFIGNSKELQGFNSRMQELLVGAAINQITADDLTKEGLNVERILTGMDLGNLPTEKINKAFETGKLSDYAEAWDNFSDKMKASLTNTGTLFDIFSNKSTNAIQSIVKEFDSLNFTVEQTQFLMEALGSENAQKMSEYIDQAKLETGDLWDQMSSVGKQNAVIRQMRKDMDDHARKLRETAADVKKTGDGIFNGKELSENAQNWLLGGKLTDALNNAKRTDKDFTNKKIKQLKETMEGLGITEWTDEEGVKYTLDQLKGGAKFEDPIIQSLYALTTRYSGVVATADAAAKSAEDAAGSVDGIIISETELQEKMTKLSSSMSTFSKISKGDMSFAEKIELATKNPELAESIMSGELSAKDIYGYFQKEYGAVRADIVSAIDKYQAIPESKRTDAEKRELQRYLLYLKELDEQSKGAFMDLGTEQIKTVTDNFSKATLAITKYSKALERLDEDSEAYAQTTQLLVQAYKDQIAAAAESIDTMTQKVEEEIRAAGFDPSDFQLVDGIYTFIGDKSKVNMTQLQILLGTLTENWGTAMQEMLNTQYEAAEKAAEADVGITKKALEEKKEAYEKYFDQIDAAQDDQEFETDRQLLLQQMSALSGGFDVASKSRLKDLKKQLRELEQQQLEKQQEEERNALLKNLDSEMETLDKTIKELIQKILEASGGTNQYSTDSFTTPVDSSLAANQATVATQANGTSTKIKLTDVGSSASGLTIGTFNVTFSDVGDNFDAEQAGYDLAAALQKAIEQKGVNVNARK